MRSFQSKTIKLVSVVTHFGGSAHTERAYVSRQSSAQVYRAQEPKRNCRSPPLPFGHEGQNQEV
jgi:hypothetical protein